MDSLEVLATAYHVSNDVALGFAVDLDTLRDVLKGLNVNGRRWWVASDPADAIDNGYMTVGHGDRHCVDRLNTVSYRVPVLTKETPWGGLDRILLLFDASAIDPDQPGFYLHNGQIETDAMEDLHVVLWTGEGGVD